MKLRNVVNVSKDDGRVRDEEEDQGKDQTPRPEWQRRATGEAVAFHPIETALHRRRCLT